MKKLTAVMVLLAGCAPTYGSISSTPMQLGDGSLAYRYQGRANFGHQLAEADRQMAEHCAAVNGGRPVMVRQDTRQIGGGGFVQAQPTGFASFSAMSNQNQEILFRCVPD
ncbi:MAG: hypothetical protein LCH92_08300 [Proteobacteria bacterium]|nr:hypothetical protein [Pseudomonadota bacterium]